MRPSAVFDQLRIARVLMMIVVTGTTAFGFGATAGRIAFAAGTAGLASMGCFLLDHLFDLRKDNHGKRAANPFSAGTLSRRTGVVLIAVLLAGAAGLASPLGWPAPVCIAAIVVVVAGLGIGILDGPVARAVSLGALQGLYALLGGLAAGPPNIGLGLTALFLLLAMTGGRVLGDVRDREADEQAGTRTIPLRYGMRIAIAFLFVFESLAYVAGAAMFLFGGLGRGWLWCLVATATAGTAINVRFALHPTSRTADLANRLSLGLLGGLYSLGMVLARLVGTPS
jgi:geranylgeranylglycerol-phosphate geranylgeranyltransferase